MNDQRFSFYHRSNGITRTEVLNFNQNKYFPIINVINGMLSVTDLFNRAYFKRLFNDTFVASGVQVMPFSSNDGENVQRIINVAGSTFYPLAVSLLMPMFMYTIVLEKEVFRLNLQSKLIEIMKINGLKMRYYWICNFIFNFLLYTVTMVIFNIFGGLILGLSLFTDTNFFLLVSNSFI